MLSQGLVPGLCFFTGWRESGGSIQIMYEHPGGKMSSYTVSRHHLLSKIREEKLDLLLRDQNL